MQVPRIGYFVLKMVLQEIPVKIFSSGLCVPVKIINGILTHFLNKNNRKILRRKEKSCGNSNVCVTLLCSFPVLCLVLDPTLPFE